jgi:pentatricopeptide repeat domain-containing protein 1
MSGQGPAGAAPDLRSLFLADQKLLSAASGAAGARPSHDAAPPTGVVGWGGAVLPQDLSSARVPWFGRSRKVPAHRARATAGHAGGGATGASAAGPSPHPPGTPSAGPPPPAACSLTSADSGGSTGSFSTGPCTDEAPSVDELVALARRAPRGERLPERVHRALHGLDSRAAALLLKDLSKAGLDERAIELFDWLRGLPERHALRALCDVYTYTAMISLCIYQQNVDRAMELLGEMRARGVERNVHTYTALMNVCIKVRRTGGRDGSCCAAGGRGPWWPGRRML